MAPLSSSSSQLTTRLDAQPTAPPPAPLALLSYDDLLVAIERFAVRARSRAENWAQLAAVVRELSPRSSADRPAETEVLTGRRWSLVNVEVSGFRGVGGEDPLRFDLRPLPGITVLHGDNGAGKSSISNAVEVALSGSASGVSAPAGPSGPASPATARTRPLWDPVHHERDAEFADVGLELVSGDERLALSWRCRRGDPRGKHRATWRHDGISTEFAPGAGWRAALALHQPVFAYADCERRVQSGRDLREYLENLLALGGSFAALSEEVARRGETFSHAAQVWEDAWVSARSRLAEVDEVRRRDDGVRAVVPVAEPSLDDDPDAWLAREGLTDAGQALPVVDAGQFATTTQAAAELLAANAALTHAASGSVHRRLAAPLVALLTNSVPLDEPGEVCPVCDTSGVDWLTALQTNVDRLGELAPRQRRVAEALRRLEAAADALDDFTEVLVDLPDAASADAAARFRELHAAFRRAVRGHGIGVPAGRGDVGGGGGGAAGAGVGVDGAVLRAARTLADWLLGEQFSAAHRAAVEHSARETQWRRARHSCVAVFVTVWREVGDNARQAAPWRKTADLVPELRDHLKQGREAVVGTQLDDRVQLLLNDVGLRVKTLKVGQRAAALDIEDAAGRRVELGMLSAGQRNALLLAPLFATARGGPFNFLVLDDPVHAFDGIRVDRLAQLVRDLAVERRVVVLTHDRRLVEHLSLGDDATEDHFTVVRDPVSGQVTVTATQMLWSIMLSDALALLTNPNVLPGRRLPVTDVVRGLCRQAVDNAIRVFVVRTAVRAGRDPEADATHVDDALKTEARFARARKLLSVPAGTDHPVDLARQRCGHHLTSWHQAAHGNPARTPATKAEIRAARQACEILVSSPR